MSSNFEKFHLFVRGVLESLSLLFELTTFAEVGAHAEEFLEYLQSCAKIEEEMTFLAVQQVINPLNTNPTKWSNTLKFNKLFERDWPFCEVGA